GCAIYVAIALSGMTALSSEVIWTRLLSLLFGGTVYTFSLILAVFLFGLGIGSSVGSGVGPASARPRVAFGWCQMLLCGAIAWSAYMLTQSMPYWPINPSNTTDPGFNFQLYFVRCMWVVLPGSILWGASFPLALASLASRGQDPARLLGGGHAGHTTRRMRAGVAARTQRLGAAVPAGLGVAGLARPGSRASRRRRLCRQHRRRDRRLPQREPAACRVAGAPGRGTGAETRRA